jgi:hypothetical protein
VPSEPGDYDKRYVDWRHEDDGSVTIRARLSPEEGALVIKAIEKLRNEVKITNRVPDGAEDGSAEPPRDRADALVEMARRELAGEKASGPSADRYTVMVHVDASVLGGEDGACHIEDGSAIPRDTLRRLTCDGSLVTAIEDDEGNVLNVGRKTRTIPTAIRRALVNRDGGCRFPGCTHRAFVDGHHVKHWSKGGETSLRNLVLLCPFHHRLIHEGSITVAFEQDNRFTFTRDDGRIIETAAMSVRPGEVERRNQALGIAIDPQTSVPKWCGYRWDLSVALDGLMRRNGIQMWSGSAEPPSSDICEAEAVAG